MRATSSIHCNARVFLAVIVGEGEVLAVGRFAPCAVDSDEVERGLDRTGEV